MNKSLLTDRPSGLLVDMIVQYANWRLSEKGSSAESIRAYERCLYRVADDLPRATMSELEPPAGTEYLRKSIARHWGHTSKSTRAKNISYIRSFFRWCYEENFIGADPSDRLSRPKNSPVLRRRPSEEEMVALLNACEAFEVPTLLLLGWLGLRASEAVSIRWAHVDFPRHEVTVPTRKGGAPGKVRLYDDVRERLAVAYAHLGDPPDTQYLFTAKRRLYRRSDVQDDAITDPECPRTREALWLFVRRLGKRAGVGPFPDSSGRLRYYSPHSLRHGAATRWLKAGARVDTVQQMLAHRQIATTKRYLDELEPEAVEDDLNRALAGRLT